MWKKEDGKSDGIASNVPAPANPVSSLNAGPPNAPSLSGALPTASRAAACISQGIKIKGELSGSEDLFVDGVVEGKLSLTTNSCLTVGPNGHVKADVSAREVIVRGRIEGKVTGRDRVQLWSSGQVIGEVQTDRLAIEDGAWLRGRVEAGKQPNKTAEIKASASTATSKPVEAPSVNSGTAAD